MPTEASVTRFVRRQVHKGKFEVFIACLPGVEDDTAAEVHQIFPELVPTIDVGGLTVDASLTEVYRLNLGLSTANRVLLRLGTFDAWSFPMLLSHASRIYWPAFVPDPLQVEIRISVKASRLNMKDRIRSVIASSIEEAFGGFCGMKPNATSSILVRVMNDRVVISLDTSGEHLHKRGNRRVSGIAPIRSTLVSTAIRRLWSSHDYVLCDPFCGSGTVLVEALRMAVGLAPGAKRVFAFMDHPYFRPGSWRQVLREDAAQRGRWFHARLYGGDVRDSAVGATLMNLREYAESPNLPIDLQVRDFEETLDLALAAKDRGVIITNPPYGVRLGTNAEAHALHSRFIARLERIPVDWKFAIFTPSLIPYEASRGLQIRRRDRFSVGGLSVYLLEGGSRPPSNPSMNTP